MADATNTKLKYHRGTCFGCRKCLYCAVDLRQITCNCKKSLVPTKKNRTHQVKQAYPRKYEPTWTGIKFEYIDKRVLDYNYQINVKKPFNFSLCSRCNNILNKLNPTKTISKKKSSNKIMDVATDEVMANTTNNSTDMATDKTIDEVDLTTNMTTDILSKTNVIYLFIYYFFVRYTYIIYNTFFFSRK